MDKKNIIKRTVTGGGVVGLITTFQYLIALITQIILARILSPSHFGVLAFILMLTLFFNNFNNIHGDKYLIKESKINDQKINNVFTIELILTFLVFILFISFSPYLMKVLGKQDQIIFVQFIALSFFYTPFSRIRALYERNLTFFKANIPILISKGVNDIGSRKVILFEVLLKT